MPDREKVIKGLETILDICNAKSDMAFGKGKIVWAGYANDVDDAITLLKEQTAVEPTFKQDEKGIFVWCCGSCGAYMYHIYDGIDKAKEYAKFCRQCGRPVKWE